VGPVPTTTTTTDVTTPGGSDDGTGGLLGGAAESVVEILGAVAVAVFGAGVLGVFGLVLGVFVLGGAATLGYGAVVLGVATIAGAEAAASLPYGRRIQSVPQVTLSTLIGTSSATVTFFDSLGAATASLGTGLSAAADVPRALGSILASAPRAIGGGFTAGMAGLAGAFGGALSTLSLGLGRRSAREQDTAATEDAREAGGPDPETTWSGEPEPPSIAEAYDMLTDALTLPNQQARTPGEVARAAIDRGWPEGPVRRLVAVFREIRYGGRTETDERTGRARSAVRQLREFLGGSQ